LWNDIGLTGKVPPDVAGNEAAVKVNPATGPSPDDQVDGPAFEKISRRLRGALPERETTTHQCGSARQRAPSAPAGGSHCRTPIANPLVRTQQRNVSYQSHCTHRLSRTPFGPHGLGL